MLSRAIEQSLWFNCPDMQLALMFLSLYIFLFCFIKHISFDVSQWELHNIVPTGLNIDYCFERHYIVEVMNCVLLFMVILTTSVGSDWVLRMLLVRRLSSREQSSFPTVFPTGDTVSLGSVSPLYSETLTEQTLHSFSTSSWHHHWFTCYM